MRSMLFILPCFFIFLAGNTSAQQNNTSTGKWKLVWSDEFNYKGLPDTSKWSFNTGGNGFGNHEKEYYTKARLENARVENGHLIIEARKEDWEQNHYTSAKLVSKGKGDWLYGRFEVRAKLPRGRGTWPAIWMLASKTPMRWPDDGEIDIMEHVGYDPGKIHGTVHTKSYNHVLGTQKSAIIDVTDCMDAFHVYAIEWTPEEIGFFVDGKKYFGFRNEHKTHAEWPYDSPFYMILNLAIGGDWGGQKGIDDSIFPQQMQVDYVRVYQKS